MNIFEYIKEKIPLSYLLYRINGSTEKCPLCESKNFKYSENKKVFYCFECHRGGDILVVLCHINKCSMKEAVSFLIQNNWEEFTDQDE